VPSIEIVSTTPQPGFLRWWLALLLVLMTLLAYQPAWHAGFIWDDHSHVEENPALSGPGGWKQIWLSRDSPQYYPLVFSSFRLERAFWGLNPAGYHLVNLLLHAANALLLWQLFRRLGLPGGWLAAAIFALHPVNVESVAWITERKNTLSMFFFLLSLLLFIRSEGGPTSKTTAESCDVIGVSPPSSILYPRSSLFYGLSLFAFLLALFSKTAVAPLPVVLLGLAWWRRGRLAMRDVWRSLPFFIAVMVLIPITVLFEHQAGSEVVREDSLWARVAGAGWGFWFYLYKAALPVNLIFVYPRWCVGPSHPASYLPAVLVVGLLLVCWLYRHAWGKACLAGVGFFGLMLLPALGLVNIYFMRYSLVSDHWQYVAMVGPLALAAAGFTRALGRTLPWGKSVAVGVVLLTLAVLTFRQSAAYLDDETLWRATIKTNPECWMAYNNLGTILVRRHDIDGGIGEFQKALRLRDDYPEAHNNLGIALARKGEISAAIREFQAAIKLAPVFAQAHDNLAHALVQTGNPEEAIAEFQQVLRLKPDFAYPHYNLGLALARKGQIDEAILLFQEAIRLKPDFADAHHDLGIALVKKSNLDEAILHFEQAIRLKPDFSDACHNLGAALARKGRIDEAILRFEQAVRLKPDFADAHTNLARALRIKRDSLVR
jgi:protein O-mannosyl-transferase